MSPVYRPPFDLIAHSNREHACNHKGSDDFEAQKDNWLPKLLLGNNWQMLYDIPGAIPLVDAIFARSPALPPLPSVAQMSLSRLDICYNYQLGTHPAPYIEALSRLDYPHRTTVRFDTQTVEFRCKSVNSKFYDKHAETLGQSPPGILRHEITLQGARTIRTALGFTQPTTLADLSLPLLALPLQRDLQRLSIFDTPFATHNRAAAPVTKAHTIGLIRDDSRHDVVAEPCQMPSL